MTNLNVLPLDFLLMRVQVIDDMMPGLSQRGLEKAQDELSAIESELDSRKPECEFRTLYSPGVRTREPVGFEPIYGDYLDDWNQWYDYGLQF